MATIRYKVLEQVAKDVDVEVKVDRIYAEPGRISGAVSPVDKSLGLGERRFEILDDPEAADPKAASALFEEMLQTVVETAILKAVQ